MKKEHTVYIHSGDGDVCQRWYCYYYTLVRGIKTRKRFYGGVNREKRPQVRMALLCSLQKKLQQKINIKNPAENTLCWYLHKVIADKALYFKESSRRNYKVHLNLFIKWLVAGGCKSMVPAEVTTQHIHQYKTKLLTQGLSNRTVNNYLHSLRSAFTYIKKSYGIAFENPCTITALPTVSNMHQAYTAKQLTQIAKHLERENPELLFYIRFISYAFLRCCEVRKLRVRNIDFDRMIIRMQTGDVKTNESRHKKILSHFTTQVNTLRNLPENYFVFGRHGAPGLKPVGERYFCKQFLPIKQKFALTKLHTLYGFRHTIVSQLLQNGADKFDVMKYTGHTTLSAFEKYARSIFALEPKDLSDKITVYL